MEVEITLKRKQGRLRKSLKECVKKALEQYRGWKRGEDRWKRRWKKREDAYNWKKWWELIKAKIANPTSQHNGMKQTLLYSKRVW